MKNALTSLLLIALAGLGAFTYLSLRDSQQQVQQLTAKLDAASKAANIDLQEKCAKRAREEFRDFGWDKKPFAGFTNHYNDRLNKCFVMIENTDAETVKGTIFQHKNLSDAFEGKSFGEYSWATENGKKYWEVKPFICRVTLPSGEDATCNSSDEFDAMIKYYME